MSPKNKSNTRAKTDRLSREHAKRHGVSIKRGLARAKRARMSVRKAASRDRGKTLSQIADELLLPRRISAPEARKKKAS